MTDAADKRIAELESKLAQAENLKNLWRQKADRYQRVINEVIGAVEDELPGCPNCDW